MSAGTRARLSPGEQLRGEGRPLSVTGCLLFKEWDPEDRRHYFWEEWQLSGMDDYDTWVKYLLVRISVMTSESSSTRRSK